VPAAEWRAAPVVLIDTNLYIRAFRDLAARRTLQAFQRRVLARLALHGVVAMELRSGALTATQRVALDDLIAPFREWDRMLGVSADAYIEAGRVLAALRREGRAGPSPSASFVQDVVLAASAREHRAVLVTDNARDFISIRTHLRGFQFVPPWP
jgi:predicted nucleic acid-binding protein